MLGWETGMITNGHYEAYTIYGIDGATTGVWCAGYQVWALEGCRCV